MAPSLFLFLIQTRKVVLKCISYWAQFRTFHSRPKWTDSKLKIFFFIKTSNYCYSQCYFFQYFFQAGFEEVFFFLNLSVKFLFALGGHFFLIYKATFLKMRSLLCFSFKFKVFSSRLKSFQSNFQITWANSGTGLQFLYN